jgi:predicted ATPase/class 3 adenylate cyclase/DNA-binding CsgD family transcriptional regulator
MPDDAAPDSVRRLPSGTVTFLLTDLEGSARLWEHSAADAAVAVARHYELLDAAIAAHGGARPLEQGEGDSVVAVFARAPEAVAAAVDVQRAFAAESWPAGQQVRVRIALHTGAAHLRDDANYFGPTVIRCARLRAIAHGGQTLLSGATHDLVASSLPPDAQLRDLGSHRLKDLGQPEHVWQISVEGLPDDFPPVRSLGTLPNNLPTQLSTFVGRDHELTHLHDALTRSRLVTLTGTGGCGKTRLALQAAADVADDHQDGVWWVELAPVSRPELVAQAVATALGLREEPDRSIEDTLIEQLDGSDALIVLDNCEQVLDVTAHLVERLLSALPRLRVIATSREPLGIASEVAWRVPSLDSPSAVALFVHRARQARPAFEPQQDELHVIGQICARLDGVPLAIELAAARTRMMSPATIASALDDRFRLLTGGSRTLMPRQQTLEASVGWSFDLLEESERVLVRRLSVFAGGFTLGAVEAVGADESIDTYAVLDLLSRLVDKSLVQVDLDAGGTRYRLLETIRQYMSERLIEAGESDATRRQHLAHYLAFSETAEPELVTADGPDWLERLDRDRDNLRVALEWAADTGEHQQLLRLVTALTLFFELRGHLADGGRWFSRALDTTDDDKADVLRARALWGAAHVALYAGQFETAARRAPECFALAEAVGDEWAMGRSLNTIGYLQMQTEPVAARAVLDRSIEIGRRTGDEWAVADGLKMLTVAWVIQEHHVEARAALDALAAAARRLGNGFFIAWYHAGVAYFDVLEGDFEAARRELGCSIEHCDRVGDPATRGLAVAWLAHLDALTGEYAAARESLETLLARARVTGAEIAVPDALMQLANLALACGELDTAREHLQPIIEISSGMPVYHSWAHSILGATLIHSGETAAAREALASAKAAAQAIDNHWLIAMADHWLAVLASTNGEAGDAEQLHHEALALQRGRNLRPAIIETIEALATLAVEQQSPAEAARLFGAAGALRNSIGLARPPIAQPSYDEAIERIRDDLTTDELDAAWSQGEALSMEDALEYVTRARGERKRPTSGWNSLTPTELRVVALVSEGLTNPQIAERLFIARGTVKVHLAHIFTKVDVSTRSELAAAATRRSIA